MRKGMRGILLAGLTSVLGCRRESPPAPGESRASLPSAVGSVSAAPAVTPTPVVAAVAVAWPERAAVRFEAPAVEGGVGRAGSTLALAVVQKRRLALIADEDQGAVLVVDRDRQELVSTTRLPGAPSQLLVRNQDGRLYVALRDRNVVQAYEVGASVGEPLTLRGEIATGTEPVGLALTTDEQTLLVTTAWSHRLEAFALPTRSLAFSAPLPREPRSVVVTGGDRPRAFIAHVVGSVLSVVDVVSGISVQTARTLSTRGRDMVRLPPPPSCRKWHHFRPDPEWNFQSYEPSSEGTSAATIPAVGCGGETVETPRQSVQGYALAMVGERVFAPVVLVDPGEAKVPTAGAYGDMSAPFPPEVPAVGVVALGEEKVATNSLLVQGTSGARPCLLPRAALAIEEPGSRGKPGRTSVLVACAGIDAVVEYDGSALDPARAERRRWAVPAGPSGLALDGPRREVLAWSQFDRSLSSWTLAAATGKGPAEAPRRLDLPAREPATRWLSDEARLGRRLFHATGNASIAQDGRGCASCHPDGRDDALTWASPEGARNTPMLAGRLTGTAPFGWTGGQTTVEEHMQQTLKRLRGKGLTPDETRAVVAYLETMPTPVRATAATSEQVARGRDVFRSEATLCSVCHERRAPFTDHAVHDVQSGSRLDTPSLLFVGGTGPYFHDGRYATLRQMLLDCDGKMGQTKQLGPDDLSALEAYLESL